VKKARHHSQCRAKTKDGKPCRAAARANGLCLFHGDPNLASELGRKGGRSKRQVSAETADTMKSVHEMNKRLFDEVYSGETSRSDASTLVRILKSITDSIRFTDHEQRLIKLEEARAQSENGSGGPDGGAPV
jgi:general stress protein YciG